MATEQTKKDSERSIQEEKSKVDATDSVSERKEKDLSNRERHEKVRESTRKSVDEERTKQEEVSTEAAPQRAADPSPLVI